MPLMSDALLERIAVALETIARATGIFKPEAAEKPAKPPKQPKATAADPASAAGASTAASPAPATTAAPAGATSSDDIMTQAANAVINLANNFSRDSAVEAMAKFGAKKVSQITDPAQLKALLADVQARIEAEKAKKANESLV
jgi:hypothetical protein